MRGGIQQPPDITVSDHNLLFGHGSKNAWDDVSGIDEYVRALTSFQRNRGKVQVLRDAGVNAQHHDVSQGIPDDLEEQVKKRRESLILTDFPTSVERPSLPVTPAPRRRSSFWGEERDEQGALPQAEGVPDQAEWNPNEKLEQLRKNSLMGPPDLNTPSKREIPRRNMPGSSFGTIPEEPKADQSNITAGPLTLKSSEDITADLLVAQHTAEINKAKVAPTFIEPDFGAQGEAKAEELLSPTEHGSRSFGEAKHEAKRVGFV